MHEDPTASAQDAAETTKSRQARTCGMLFTALVIAATLAVVADLVMT